MPPSAAINPSALTIAPPNPAEYAPYFGRYISLVPGADILKTLDSQRRRCSCCFPAATRPMATSATRPINGAPKRSSAMSATRSASSPTAPCASPARDQTPIEGYEQDDYVRNGPFGHAPFAELIEDYIAVRRATLTLLRNLDESAWNRRGTANKNEASVRALAYLIAGHELHHRKILEEKYFAASRA